MRIKKILLSLGLVAVGTANGFAPTMFFPPYDPALRLPYVLKKDPLRVGANFEFGETKKGYNWDSKRANVLCLYDDSQSTIAMIEQPTPTVLGTTNFVHDRNQLRVAGARDDGQRGHIRLSGKFEGWDITPHIRYVLPFDVVPGELAISAYLPFRYAKVTRTTEDLTENLIFADMTTHALLTDVIADKAKTWGGLDLNNWDATDLGDLVIMLDWHNDYPQEKESLKNVTLHAKFGLSCPTGLEKNEDKVFSMALGNDGAWSIPFGLGLDLDFKHHVSLGAEANFEVIFDNTKDRRMKTHPYQTEFLMLNKGRATMDHGFLWKFYLYLQGFHFYKGLSLKGAYEYVKKDSDSLSPKSDDFNASVANGAKWLDEFNSHHVIFSLNYDFFKEFKSFKPQLSLFYKVPVGGKGVIAPDTIGGQLAVSF